MSVFPWRDKYSVYVEGIDVQHQRLVELLDSLATAMSSGQGHEVIEATLDGLIEYTMCHFEEEEKYFGLVEYPDADKHREEHKQLTEDVLKFQSEFKKRKNGLSVELMRFLKEWLDNHIGGTDKELGIILRDNGIQNL